MAETRPGGVAVAASYDGHARLEGYNRTNIGAQTYTYNGLGDRVRVNKPTGTRHFVYDSQGRVVAEYGASSAEVKAEFIWAVPPAANDNSPFGGDDGIVGCAPLALVAENGLNSLELYWVHGNHLGVPIVTTNALGQVVDPGNDFLRPGFPGQSQVLSDLYYNRARDYDPVLGRYIQADPIGLLGDVNPYLYAAADPMNMIDPDGLWVRQLAGALIFGGGNLAYQLYNNGGRFDCVDWWEVGGWAFEGTGLAGLIPKLGGRRALRELWRDNAGSVPGPKAPFSREKQALVEMAKMDKRQGLRQRDMDAYRKLNDSLPDPFPPNKVRSDPGHPRGGPHSRVPHGHVGPVGHIPITGP